MIWYKFITTLHHYEQFRHVYLPHLTNLYRGLHSSAGHFKLYVAQNNLKTVDLYLETDDKKVVELMDKTLPVNIQLPARPSLGHTSVLATSLDALPTDLDIGDII